MTKSEEETIQARRWYAVPVSVFTKTMESLFMQGLCLIKKIRCTYIVEFIEL